MRFALFETPLGPSGLVWSERGIARLVFTRRPELLRERFVTRRWVEDQNPPRFVQTAMVRLRAHLAGQPREFDDLPLDLKSVPSLMSVARVLRTTRSGETMDAGELAVRAGIESGSAGVRRLLARNPIPVLLPGHRVLGADGLVGAWGGGEGVQERLLRLESAVHPPLHGPDGSPDPGRVESTLALLRARDPVLGALIDRVGPLGLTLRRGHGPYEALARSIVGQQITGRAAQAILARLAAVFRTPGVPPPARVRSATASQLRAAGLSAGKARALRDLAERALAGGVPPWSVLRRWSDERIIATLTEVHGIGRWTVEMVLIFRLGRPDVLPLGDYGVRKGYARTFSRGRLPSLREMERRGWRWRPFRSVASWYLWRALELG